MHDDDRSFDEQDWTNEERAQLETIGAHRSPRAELKARTVESLRGRGLVGARRTFSTGMMIGLAAAAALVFAIGTLVGYQAALRRANENRIDATRAASPGKTRDVARIDSNTQPAATRHVVWF